MNESERQWFDTDHDKSLSFDEFCQLVRDRELGDHSDDELRARFNALDTDGDGSIDLREYLKFSLTDALQRSATKITDLFKQWDEDGSGTVDKAEWTKAITALGFAYPESVILAVFSDFDADGDGLIEIAEVNATVDAEVQKGVIAKDRELRRVREKAQAFSGSGKMELDADDDRPIMEQLKDLLAKNGARVIDLFRKWDKDESGTVNKKEVRRPGPAPPPRAPHGLVADALSPIPRPAASGSVAALVPESAQTA